MQLLPDINRNAQGILFPSMGGVPSPLGGGQPTAEDIHPVQTTPPNPTIVFPEHPTPSVPVPSFRQDSQGTNMEPYQGLYRSLPWRGI